MADPITRRNETARRRAETAGRLTYSHDVVDSWPACVQCATPIKHRARDEPGGRGCGCPGVRWRARVEGGWFRFEREETTDA